MTPLQYERWKDFALRAARTWFKTHRRPDAAWVETEVSNFFAYGIDEDDIVCVVDWDNSTDYPEGHRYRRQDRNGRWEHPCCVGDMMIDFMDQPRGYPPRCRACAEYENESECRCDEIEERYYAQWDDQWGGPIRCCIRAGLDLAASPSMGVVGFTAGDLRAMYPEGVPDWVQNGDWSTQRFQACSIGLIPVECEPDPKPFSEIPDEQGVWL